MPQLIIIQKHIPINEPHPLSFRGRNELIRRNRPNSPSANCISKELIDLNIELWHLDHWQTTRNLWMAHLAESWWNHVSVSSIACQGNSQSQAHYSYSGIGLYQFGTITVEEGSGKYVDHVSRKATLTVSLPLITRRSYSSQCSWVEDGWKWKMLENVSFQYNFCSRYGSWMIWLLFGGRRYSSPWPRFQN